MAEFQRQNYCDCFDFPVAWIFFRSHCREIHGFDPGDNQPVASFTSESSKTRASKALPPSDSLTPIKAHLVDLQNRLNKHIDATRKPKTKAKYTGLKE